MMNPAIIDDAYLALLALSSNVHSGLRTLFALTLTQVHCQNVRAARTTQSTGLFYFLVYFIPETERS
jgi:hypothetical protein